MRASSYGWAILWIGLVGSLALVGMALSGHHSPGEWGEGQSLLVDDHDPSGLWWLAALAGLAHLLIIPGWLASSALGIRGAARLGVSCPLSVVVWMVFRALLFLCSATITTGGLVLLYAGIETLLLLVLVFFRFEIWKLRPCISDYVSLGTALLVFVLIGPDKLTRENFSGDGVEAYSFARSLDSGPLPNWDLENGTWGFYPSFMSFAYPLHLSKTLLGASEASARLPLLVFVMGITALLLSTRRKMSTGFGISMAVVLMTLTSAWNYTYDPYFADISEPTSTDLFFSLCLLVSVWALQSETLVVFVVGATLAATAQPAGFPFISLLLLFVLIVGGRNRKWVLSATALFALAMLLRALVASAWNPPGSSKFTLSVFLSHHTSTLLSGMGPRQILTQFWALLVQSGGAAILFVPQLWQRFRESGRSRGVLVPVVVYLAAVLITPKRHAHYLTPVVALILYCLPEGSIRMQRFWWVILVLLIYGVLPNPNPEPDRKTEEFGSATWMVFRDERDAIDNADLLYSVLTIPPWRTESNWGPGKHAWVLYSAHSHERPETVPAGAHLLFSEYPQPWTGFHLVTDNGTSFLYEQPAGWLAEQNKQGGCTSCWGPLLKVPYLLWDSLSRWKV